LPTGVGLRYGQRRIWLEAFLGGMGTNDFCPLARTRHSRHATMTGICLGHALRSMHRSCPFERLTFPTASPLHSSDCLWCRTVHLLAIAYDYNVLGLGPD
jgi:hypothetical protein